MGSKKDIFCCECGKTIGNEVFLTVKGSRPSKPDLDDNIEVIDRYCVNCIKDKSLEDYFLGKYYTIETESMLKLQALLARGFLKD